MWTVENPTLTLPQAFELLEDEDEVRLRCRTCGYETVYWCCHVERAEIEGDAYKHALYCRGFSGGE